MCRANEISTLYSDTNFQFQETLIAIPLIFGAHRNQRPTPVPITNDGKVLIAKKVHPWVVVAVGQQFQKINILTFNFCGNRINVSLAHRRLTLEYDSHITESVTKLKKLGLEFR